MATHPAEIRTSIADHVTAKLNAGTANTEGSLQFLTSGDVAIATLRLNATAFAAAVAGVATANAIADDTNAVGGDVAKCILRDRDDATIIEGTVGTSGTDIIVSSTTIPVGSTISVTSLTYTAPL